MSSVVRYLVEEVWRKLFSPTFLLRLKVGIARVVDRIQNGDKDNDQVRFCQWGWDFYELRRFYCQSIKKITKSNHKVTRRKIGKSLNINTRKMRCKYVINTKELAFNELIQDRRQEYHQSRITSIGGRGISRPKQGKMRGKTLR